MKVGFHPHPISKAYADEHDYFSISPPTHFSICSGSSGGSVIKKYKKNKSIKKKQRLYLKRLLPVSKSFSLSSPVFLLRNETSQPQERVQTSGVWCPIALLSDIIPFVSSLIKSVFGSGVTSQIAMPSGSFSYRAQYHSPD